MEAFASTQIDPAAGNHSDSARNDAAPTDEMARRPNCTDAASPMRTRAATVSAEGVGASEDEDPGSSSQPAHSIPAGGQQTSPAYGSPAAVQDARQKPAAVDHAGCCPPQLT